MAKTTVNLCVYGVPPPPYIKEWRRGRADPLWRAPRGVLLPPGVGFPPFPSWIRREGRGRKVEGKGGLPNSMRAMHVYLTSLNGVRVCVVRVKHIVRSISY